MCMEAKNSKFKRKNIPHSLAVYQQQSMCYDQSAPLYVRSPNKVRELELIAVISPYEHVNALLSACVVPPTENTMVTVCSPVSLVQVQQPVIVNAKLCLSTTFLPQSHFCICIHMVRRAHWSFMTLRCLVIC